MTKRQTPPGRKSKACVVVVKPFGPHHCARCFGSVQTENTRWRGALNTCVPMIDRGSCSRSRLFFSATSLLPFVLLVLRLKCFEGIAQAIAALLPKLAIFLEPVIGFLERQHVDAARTHLGIARARNETSALQHLEVFGDDGQAHVERPRKLEKRSVA